jgi:hypothetical protein
MNAKFDVFQTHNVLELKNRGLSGSKCLPPGIINIVLEYYICETMREIIENVVVFNKNNQSYENAKYYSKYGIILRCGGESLKLRYREGAIRLGLESFYDQYFDFIYNKNILPYVHEDFHKDLHVSRDWLKNYYSIYIDTRYNPGDYWYDYYTKPRNFVVLHDRYCEFNEQLFINMFLRNHSKCICSIPKSMREEHNQRNNFNYCTLTALNLTRIGTTPLTSLVGLKPLVNLSMLDYTIQFITYEKNRQMLLKLKNEMNQQEKLAKIAKLSRKKTGRK